VNRKRFDMGTTRPGREEREPGVVSTDLRDEDPFDRMNIELKRSLRLLFAQEAARRDMKKRELANEIFAFYFTHKDTIMS
jgi:hypothetical protein